MLWSHGIVSAQEPQTPKFRVAVDAVRIDAVVTDGDGNIVRDLTAADFEILQDGKKQAVTFAQFVPVAAGTSAPAATVPRNDKRGEREAALPAPPVSAPVRRETIQRTIAIVVDDLGLSVESLNYVKKGLHDFVDRSTQPGDLVALVRTGGSLDGLQPFTTDRRVLHAAIDNLKWNAFSRSGVEAFPAVNMFPILTPSVPAGPFGNVTGAPVGDFTTLDTLHNNAMAAGTLGALNLVIQGAKNLPGRKAVLFVSEGFAILDKDLQLNGVSRSQVRGPETRVRAALDRTVDQATRAGVVVYSIDARGLQSGSMQAADDFNCSTPCPNDMFERLTRDKMAERSDIRRDTQEGMAYLAEQTGGFAVFNTNDLGKGLARAAADVRDYYVIGYAPETSTFAAKGKTPEYHKISVRVTRPGLKVRTRREFLGISDADPAEADETPAQRLVDAAISPFTATDIALRATTLPGYAADRGLFVRALLHIDASALTFAPDESGKPAASADVLGMVFDRDGTEVAHLSTGFAAALTKEGAEGALRDGLAYTLRIPIPRAGPYQIRFAVRDRQSGKLGTAGEFVDVPDVAHGVFALSGIVLRGNDDLAAGSGDADRVMISPSQAVRVYKPGTQLRYACEIYNPPGPVQLTLSIWRGSDRVITAAPDTLTPPDIKERWFAAGGAFKLGDGLSPGRYVLQLAAQAKDGKSGGLSRATQAIDFEVR